MRHFIGLFLLGPGLFLLLSCAEPVPSKLPSGPQIPAIDDTASISIITWNIEKIDEYMTSKTVGRVRLIMDSLDADFYCVQEIERKSVLQEIIDGLDRYSVIISDATSLDHLAIVYKHDSFLPLFTENLFDYNDYNFAGRPPLMVSFGYTMYGQDQVINLIDLHMKCCEEKPSDLVRRHDAAIMLHEWMTDQMAWGDSNFIVVGDWNDDIHDPDGSGQYAFEAFLEDTDNYSFVTDSLAAIHSTRTASYPSWNSFLDNILISRSLFDEAITATVRTLRLDEVFGDYSTVVSDHRPVLWSFKPN